MMKNKKIIPFSLIWILIWIVTLSYGTVHALQKNSRVVNTDMLGSVPDLYQPHALLEGVELEPPTFFQDVHYGSFEDITWDFQPAVIKVNGLFTQDVLNKNLKVLPEINIDSSTVTPQTRLLLGATISKEIIQRAIPSTRAPSLNISIGSILVDEQNGVALKIIGQKTVDQEEVYEVTRPQLQEVLRDFKIPNQAVYLTQNNLIPVSSEVAESIITLTRGTATEAIKNQFPDPLIALEFNNKIFNIEAGDQIIKIVLDGILIIDKVRVDGGYSCFGSYHFQVGTGEGIGLDADVKTQIDHEVTLPLFAIDIPAGIAHVRGGLYLIVGLNGKFSIGVHMGEWAKASLGLQGSTAFCVPTSFHPIGAFEKKLFGNADFLGEIHGELKAGPMLDLELFGWDLAGAGALTGFGANCKGTVTSDGFYRINADLYVPLRFYLTFLGGTYNILKNTFLLAQLQKVYSAGTDSSGNIRKFDVTFQEACAYRQVVWGKVLDLTAPLENDKPAPLRNSQVEITVNHNHISTKYYGSTNNKGYFAIRNVSMARGDKITVTKLDNVPVNTISIDPTFPFKQVNLNYVDFFDDSAKGQVAPVRVVDWDATNLQNNGEIIYKEIKYNGDIGFEIEGDSSYPNTHSDDNGNFYYKYDFKPNKRVRAHIRWNGFDSPSASVMPDTQLAFYTTKEEILSSAYTTTKERAYTKGKKVYRLKITLINMRGTKSFGGLQILGNNYYFLLRKPYAICLGYNLKPIAPLIGATEFRQVVPEDKLPLNGSSSFERIFISEWEWPTTYYVQSRRASSNVTSDFYLEGNIGVSPISKSYDPIIAGEFCTEKTEFKFATSRNIFIEGLCDVINQNVLDRGACQLFVENYDELYSMLLNGFSPIYEHLYLKFFYEGEEILLQNINNAHRNPNCRPVDTAGPKNPVDLLLREKVWSRINPAPVDIESPITVINQPFLDINTGLIDNSLNLSLGQDVTNSIGSGLQLNGAF